MTKEEILAALKNLQNHATSNTSEQQAEIDNETAELDATIEEYNEKIAELEEKLANVDNYQYVEPNKEERELTEELLEESFTNQLEVLDKEDTEYKHLQDLATSIFTDYNEEIAQLNVDIAAIERRLRKNDIAVKKNIGIKLTDEELADLNSTLQTKKARIVECEKYKLQYTEELSNYGELITANNRKREIVTKKQERLAAIKAERTNNPKTVDNYKLQRDKDELASLKAGLLALQSRRDYINYDMKSEIDKLIKETESLNFEMGPESVDKSEKPEDNKNDIEADNEFSNTGFKVDAHAFDDVEPTDEKDTLGIPEETSAHDLWLQQNSPLDEEREAEIEEAKEELKKKKKDGFFKKHWKKFVAAGLALVAALVVKGCNDLKTATSKDVIEQPYSYSQEAEPEEEKSGDMEATKTNVTKPAGKTVSKTDQTPSVETTDFVQEPSVEENNYTVQESPVEENNYTVQEPSVEDNNYTTQEPSVEENNYTTQEPSNTEVQPDTDPTPAVDQPQDVVEENKKTVELNPGDKIISVTDLFNDNINEETVISHGDAVGTATDSAELTDYTEEGNAVVEYDTGDQQEVKKMTKEEYKALLDKLSGGTGVLTPEGEQWLDELASGKTR